MTVARLHDLAETLNYENNIFGGHYWVHQSQMEFKQNNISSESCNRFYIRLKDLQSLLDDQYKQYEQGKDLFARTVTASAVFQLQFGMNIDFAYKSILSQIYYYDKNCVSIIGATCDYKKILVHERKALGQEFGNIPTPSFHLIYVEFSITEETTLNTCVGLCIENQNDWIAGSNKVNTHNS